MNKQTTSPFESATSEYRSRISDALEEATGRHKLRVHAGSVSALVHDALPGAGGVAVAAVANIHKLPIERLYGGREPVMLVYLPSVSLTSGAQLAEGVYSVTADAAKATAGLHDSEGNRVADVWMETGSVPQNRYLAAKILSTDIGDITLCAEICLKVCFSVEVDGPGPFNPSIKICVEVVVKV